MTKEQFIRKLNELRGSLDITDEMKKGLRFRDDERIMRHSRMRYYGQEDIIQLPSIEDFLSNIDDKWIDDNLAKVLREIAAIDHHYQSSEKWVL